MKKFLHVGCGHATKNKTTKAFASDDWQEVRLDIDEAVNPDIVSSVLDLSIIDPGSFDAVFSSHNIEHVYAHQVPIMLKEFLRILNKDGFFVAACPNLLPIARLIVEDKLTEPAYTSPAGPIAPLDMLYGLGAAIARGNEFMAHKCGFTPKSLNAALLGAGFKGAAMMSRDRYYDIWVVATKETTEKDKLEELAKQHFPGVPTSQ